jgi:hypothetical protein
MIRGSHAPPPPFRERFTGEDRPAPASALLPRDAGEESTGNRRPELERMTFRAHDLRRLCDIASARSSLTRGPPPLIPLTRISGAEILNHERPGPGDFLAGRCRERAVCCCPVWVSIAARKIRLMRVW